MKAGKASILTAKNYDGHDTAVVVTTITVITAAITTSSINITVALIKTTSINIIRLVLPLLLLFYK